MEAILWIGALLAPCSVIAEEEIELAAESIKRASDLGPWTWIGDSSSRAFGGLQHEKKRPRDFTAGAVQWRGRLLQSTDEFWVQGRTVRGSWFSGTVRGGPVGYGALGSSAHRVKVLNARTTRNTSFCFFGFSLKIILVARKASKLAAFRDY